MSKEVLPKQFACSIRVHMNLNKMYMDTSPDTLRLLAEKEEQCMKKGDAAANIEAQRHRKEHTLHRWQQARAEDARDGDVHGAGAH